MCHFEEDVGLSNQVGHFRCAAVVGGVHVVMQPSAKWALWWWCDPDCWDGNTRRCDGHHGIEWEASNASEPHDEVLKGLFVQSASLVMTGHSE